MAHHAFFYVGSIASGVAISLTFAKEELHLATEHNPDVMVFRYGLFSVEDARRIIRLADQGPLAGDTKLMVIAVERIFHEAQNALLKVFEEPAPGTTLILVIPSEGDLLPTLRSRLIQLPVGATALSEDVRAFLAVRGEAREKIVSKLLDKIKSDKEDEKQQARGEALRLVEGLVAASYEKLKSDPKSSTLVPFLHDLERIVPIMHDRSAPYKLLFEHILLTIPRGI